MLKTLLALKWPDSHIHALHINFRSNCSTYIQCFACIKYHWTNSFGSIRLSETVQLGIFIPFCHFNSLYQANQPKNCINWTNTSTRTWRLKNTAIILFKFWRRLNWLGHTYPNSLLCSAGPVLMEKYHIVKWILYFNEDIPTQFPLSSCPLFANWNC